MKNKLLFFLLLGSTVALWTASCNYTLKVKDGPTAYELKRYHDALPMLQQAYNKAKTRAEKGKLAFMIAESYQHTGNNERSLQWYQSAYDNGYGSAALRGQAYALKQAERYKEALEAFKNLGIEIGSPYEYRKELTACQTAIEWLKTAQKSGYTVEVAPFNSPQNDFAPAWSPDGRLAFTSDRAAAQGKEPYRWTGNRYMDLFIVGKQEASAQQFDLSLNTLANEGTACFEPKSHTVFFVRTVPSDLDGHHYCTLFEATQSPDGSWGTAQPLPFQKTQVNYVHPCVSADGNTLYFSSNDPEGWGGYDLYAVERNPKSETGWNAPRLLNRTVNTVDNEWFPSMDGDTLYFASNGWGGMGGLDIYKTYPLGKQAWAPAQNLKSPINSGADDFGFLLEPVAPNAPKSTEWKPGDLLRSGFFTSNRRHPNAEGMDDIYRFDQRVPPPAPPAPDTPALAIQYKILIEGYVVERIFTNPDDPNSPVIGRRPLPNAWVSIQRNSGKAERIQTDANGYFKLEGQPRTVYGFTGQKEGYLSNSTTLPIEEVARDPKNPVQVFEVEVILGKIYMNQEIVLENIYYDYDKWDIRPDAMPTLNQLAETLRLNPNINIQLGSHTDCRGNDSYNQGLSQKRAQSAVNYLVSKGVAPERLTALGYGEQNPADNCACNQCSEAQHQRNRRTTFKIVE